MLTVLSRCFHKTSGSQAGFHLEPWEGCLLVLGWHGGVHLLCQGRACRHLRSATVSQCAPALTCKWMWNCQNRRGLGKCRSGARCLFFLYVRSLYGSNADMNRFEKVCVITSDVVRVVLKQLQNLRSEGQQHVAGADPQVGQQLPHLQHTSRTGCLILPTRNAASHQAPGAGQFPFIHKIVGRQGILIARHLFYSSLHYAVRTCAVSIRRL